MADTIRDVIIRIAIEQKPFKAVVPDLSAVTKAANDAASSAQQIFAGGPVSKPGGGTGGGRKVPGVPTKEDLDFAQQQIGELDKLLIDMGNAAAKSGKEIDKAYYDSLKIMRDGLAEEVQTQRQRIDIREKAATKFKEISVKEKLAAYQRGQDADRAKEAEDAAKRIEAAKRKEAAAERFRQTQVNTAVESIRSAGEGAFRSLRGLALITADTDEGLQQLLDRVRYVQGAWDVFSGTLQVGKGAMRAFTVAQTAATEAGGYYALVLNIVSGAQAKVGATGTAATFGVRGLAAVMTGPAVTSVLAFIAVYSAATFVMGGFAKKAEETGDDLDRLSRRTLSAADTLAGLQAANLDFQLSADLASLEDKLTTEEKILGVMDRQSEVQLKLQEINKSGVNDKIRSGEIGEKLGLEILQAEEELYKRSISLSKEKIQLIREEQDGLQKNVQKYQEIADKAKAAADQERGRVQSIQESIGRLNELERLQLQKVIDKKKAGGTLDAGDLQTLDKFGGQLTRDTVSKAYADKGKDFAEQLSLAFTGKGLTGGGSVLGDRERSAREAESNVQKERKRADKEIEDLAKLATNEITLTQESYKKLFLEVIKEQQRLRQDNERLAQDIHRGDVGRQGSR